MAPADQAAEVALVARALARLGFVHAFGHVSARAGGRKVLLTPTAPPLDEVAGGEVLELDRAGRVVRGVAGNRPLEAALHLAVYEAQPEVGAICRVQAPAIAAHATLGAVPPLLHGFGGMVEPVAWWDDPDW
jgi:HCOMODA/2-hydroxy-3-carboxy-muconic semialdehyde decarboxylase